MDKNPEDKNDTSKNIQKNEVINEFLDEIENKNQKSNENKESKDEKDPDDPFLNAEKEYREKSLQNNNYKKEPKNFLYTNELKRMVYNETNKTKEQKEMENIVFGHFKKEVNPKKLKLQTTFSPSINKNPGDVYFRAIEEMKLNFLKMRSYDRRKGVFDSKYNKNNNNFFNYNNNVYFNTIGTPSKFDNNNIYNSNFQNDLRLLNNDYLDSYSYKKKYNFNKSNDLSFSNRKKLYNNNSLNMNNIDNNKDNLFYTSLYIKKNKAEKNNEKIYNYKNRHILTETDIKEEKEIKPTYKNNNSTNIKTINSSEEKASTKIMKAYLLKFKNKKVKVKSPKNNLCFQKKQDILKKEKESMNKILYSMNDPTNPYSIIFTTSILKKYYNLDFHFKKFELGVPLLRMKKVGNSRFASSLFFPENNNRISKTYYNNNCYSSDHKNLSTQKYINTNKNSKLNPNHSDKNFYKK